MSLTVTSTAFRESETIPSRYTCDGEDLSPSLTWSGAPQGTASLALIADDPDAPSGTWVHWVLFNLPANQDTLPEGVTDLGVRGKNDFKRLGYGGPCPPRGRPHRYYFKVYALSAQLQLEEGASKAQVEKAMGGLILAQGSLMGRYSR